MPRPFIIYYPQPHSRDKGPIPPGLTDAVCDNLSGTTMRRLLESASDKLPVDLKKARLFKPEGLTLEPIDTLYSRTNDWLQQNLEVVQDRKQYIFPIRLVSRYFPDKKDVAEHEQIDILVITEELIDTLEGLSALRFQPERVLKMCRNEAEARAKNAPSPSDGTKDVHSVRTALSGDQALVHDGRPAGNYGPPPALFHPALARFDHHLRHLDDKLEELAPDPLRLRQTHFFIQECLNVYDTDDDRLQAVDEALSGALGANIFKRQQRHHSGSTAGWIWGRYNGHAAVVFELRNESGLGGDAFLRAALMYVRVVSDRKYPDRDLKTNHPVILIGLAGDHLELGSAVFLGDGVHYSTLFSQRLRLGLHVHNNVLHLAQAFKAISIAARSIMGYSSDLERHPPPADSVAHLFPAPTRLDGDAIPRNLRFKCRLSRVGDRFILPRDQDDQRSALYIATMPDPAAAAAPAADLDVVVKFTARYNADAHRLLASAGYAPQLYACARVHGGLYMIVMAHVPGRTMFYWSCDGVRVPRSVYTDLAAAVDMLGVAGLVFGDLRLQNVMCVPFEAAPESSEELGDETPGARAKLVDFDWAGTAGVDRYPATLGDSLDDWTVGIERYGVMRTEHDRGMLRKLEKHCEGPGPSEDRNATSAP